MNRQILEQPFDPKFIKKRKGNYGNMLDYIETHVVINRLNEAFDGEWSFEISEYTQLGDEVVVLGRLTADGVVKQQFGSSHITKAKGSDVPMCMGDDLKAAGSDALKKTATLMGVGLHLYGDLPVSTNDSAADDAGNTDDTRPDMSSISGNHGSDVINSDQLATIKKLRTNLGWSADDIQDHAEKLFATREVTALNPTMGAALIAYLQNQGNGRNAR